MRLTLFFITISIFSILMAACGGTPTPSNTANANTSNANLTAAHANNPLATTKKEEEATTNDAPTIAPVVHTYYDSLKKKDDAAFRSVLTKSFLQRLETDMRAEGGTNLVEYIALTESLPEKQMEVRNEKIEGDRATAEVRGGVYAVWTPMEFAKEDGKWKYTGGSSDIQSVDPGKK